MNPARLLLCSFLVGGISVSLNSRAKLPKKAKVISARVEVRNIPSSGGSVISKISEGSIVSIVAKSKARSTLKGKKSYWYKIKIPKRGRKSGWIFGAFISFDISESSGLKWSSIKIDTDDTLKTLGSSGDYLIVGAEEGGIFISSDKGETWKKISPQVLGTRLGTIHKILVEKGKIWLASSGGKKGGVWFSKDLGKSWSLFTTANGLASNEVYDIVKKGESLWAATSRGVSYSQDMGIEWRKIPKDTFKEPVFCLEVVSLTTIFAGTEEGLYKLEVAKNLLSNEEKSWKQIGKDKPNLGEEIKALKLYKSSYLLIGTDKGASRVDIPTLLKWIPFGGESSINRIYVDSKDRIFINTNEGLHISSDSGLSWIAYTEKNGLKSDKTYGTVVSSDGKVWVSLGNDGIILGTK